MKTYKQKIRELRYKIRKLQVERNILEANYEEKERGKYLNSLVGKCFCKTKDQYPLFGRVLDIKFNKEEKRWLTITECIKFYTWSTELEKGDLTDLRVDWDDFSEDWKEIPLKLYNDKKKKALEYLSPKKVNN